MHGRATSLDLEAAVDFNPFADIAYSRHNSDNGTSTSTAVSRSRSPTEFYRRSHTRARTEQNDAKYAGNHHPLRSAALSPKSTADVTRPSLSRVLNSSSNSSALVDVPASPLEAKTDEKVVLVHKVEPTDSLAGVSLKYGIALAELRKANHLWANDSIHLRKSLFIPVDKSAKAKQLIKPEPSLLDPTPASEVSDPFDRLNALSPNGEDNDFPSNIQRVPASQLSFFPPPSKKAISPPASPNGTPYSRDPSTSSPSSGPSHSLSYLLQNALPMADNIIARLSFDSISTSYGGERGRVLERERGDHELNDVRGSLDQPRQPRRSLDSILESAASPKTPKSSHRGLPNGHTLPPPSPHTMRVRTNQLQPEPSMQVPVGTRQSTASVHSNGSPGSYHTYSPGKKRPKVEGTKTRPSLRDVQFDRANGLEMG